MDTSDVNISDILEDIDTPDREYLINQDCLEDLLSPSAFEWVLNNSCGGSSVGEETIDRALEKFCSDVQNNRAKESGRINIIGDVIVKAPPPPSSFSSSKLKKILKLPRKVPVSKTYFYESIKKKPMKPVALAIQTRPNYPLSPNVIVNPGFDVVSPPSPPAWMMRRPPATSQSPSLLSISSERLTSAPKSPPTSQLTSLLSISAERPTTAPQSPIIDNRRSRARRRAKATRRITTPVCPPLTPIDGCIVSSSPPPPPPPPPSPPLPHSPSRTLLPQPTPVSPILSGYRSRIKPRRLHLNSQESVTPKRRKPGSNIDAWLSEFSDSQQRIFRTAASEMTVAVKKKLEFYQAETKLCLKRLKALEQVRI